MEASMSRLFPPLVALVMLLSVGCTGSMIRGAHIVVHKPSGECVDVQLPTIRAEDLKGLTIPTVRVDADGSIDIGLSALSTWKPAVDVKWLWVIGGVFLLGCAAALYFKTWGIAAILGTIGAGIIAAGFYPWLILLAALGGAAWIIWPIVSDR